MIWYNVLYYIVLYYIILYYIILYYIILYYIILYYIILYQTYEITVIYAVRRWPKRRYAAHSSLYIIYVCGRGSETHALETVVRYHGGRYK